MLLFFNDFNFRNLTHIFSSELKPCIIEALLFSGVRGAGHILYDDDIECCNFYGK